LNAIRPRVVITGASADSGWAHACRPGSRMMEDAPMASHTASSARLIPPSRWRGLGPAALRQSCTVRIQPKHQRDVSARFTALLA
jgi:hypothetical protein